MAWEDEIRIDPLVQGGKPVIRGTRVPVEVVVQAIAAGDAFPKSPRHTV
jgi:uncharacterized protein (DUF433 family)